MTPVQEKTQNRHTSGARHWLWKTTANGPMSHV
jgi:hypothetical protein